MLWKINQFLLLLLLLLIVAAILNCVICEFNIKQAANMAVLDVGLHLMETDKKYSIFSAILNWV